VEEKKQSEQKPSPEPQPVPQNERKPAGLPEERLRSMLAVDDVENPQ
jgi:hypothetical protein